MVAGISINGTQWRELEEVILLALVRQNQDEQEFTIDDLSGEEYTKYNEVSAAMFEDIISDFQHNGLRYLDKIQQTLLSTLITLCE